MSEMKDHVDLYWKLLGEFNTQEEYPNSRPFLAHYTSIESAIKILESNEVLMGNPFLMNDKDETKYVLEDSLRQLKSNIEIAKICGVDFGWLVECYEGFIDHFHINAYMNLYMFCCCGHSENEVDGLLSMWRGYGGDGKGAAIVFDTRNINVDAPTPFVIAKIKYRTYKQRSQWITGKLNEFLEYIQVNTLSKQELHNAAFYLFHVIKLYSIFTKHPGFHEENEWRVVYREELDSEETKGKRDHHLISHRGLEPRLKLTFSDIQNTEGAPMSSEQLIHKIILGPSSSGPFALETFKRVLDSKGYSSIRDRVVCSTIPYKGVA